MGLDAVRTGFRRASRGSPRALDHPEVARQDSSLDDSACLESPEPELGLRPGTISSLWPDRIRSSARAESGTASPGSDDDASAGLGEHSGRRRIDFGLRRGSSLMLDFVFKPPRSLLGVAEHEAADMGPTQEIEGEIPNRTGTR